MKLRIRNKVYDLNKVKVEDEDLFLDGCDRLGTYESFGFVKTILYIFGGNIPTNTKEFIKAYWFFYNRKKKLNEDKEIRVMNYALDKQSEGKTK